jgi:hypothetical protein
MLQHLVGYARGLVMVLAQEGEGVRFCGSGFICHRNGFLLTCAHILNLTGKHLVAQVPPIDQFRRLSSWQTQRDMLR